MACPVEMSVSHSSTPCTSRTEAGRVSVGPEVFRRGSRAVIDGNRSSGEVGQAEEAPPGERISLGEGAVPRFSSDQRGREAVVIEGAPDNGYVNGPVREAARRGVGLHPDQAHARV